MATVDHLAKAHRLHDQGKSYLQIAGACGTRYDTVRRWLDSEYRERQQEKDRRRKAAYGGRCASCGDPTDGSNGRAKAPKHCRSCAPAANAKWTEDAIVADIRRFNLRYGRPPAATDFNPHHARLKGRPDRAERFESDGDYPSLTMVQKVFGSWSEAIRVAGFRPNPVGYHGHGRGWTIRDAA